MNKKPKIGIFLLATLFVLSAVPIDKVSADYWTQYTRVSSNNVLPQYFELENMAKSSSGIRFLYGTDRKSMAGAGSDTHNLILFDGSNWTDQTSTVESVGGYSDIQFQTMYADSNGNIWMPNRQDPDRPLIKYNGTTSGFEKISKSTIASQAFPGGNPAQLKINNLFTGPNNNIYAVASSDNQLYIIYYDGSWHDTGITGGPTTTYGPDGDIYGAYSTINNGSYWLYKYHSSENEYSNPSGGDQGAGVWRYDSSSGWSHYDSSLVTSDGATFVNGVTEIFADSTGKVWVGSRHGVFRYDGTNWVNWTKDNNNIFTNRVIKIQEDSDGRVWIICLENENVSDDNGGISIYTPTDNSWDYYTSYNGEDALDSATNIFMLGQGGDEIWMFTGHGEQFETAGIYKLTRDSSHTALYGQTSGTTLSKASLLDMTKKKTTNKKKKVTIYKLKKSKKKWKKSKRVYKSSGYTQWYKALNLETGRYRIESQAKGKKKKIRTINVTSGEPYRSDFN